MKYFQEAQVGKKDKKTTMKTDNKSQCFHFQQVNERKNYYKQYTLKKFGSIPGPC